MTDATVSDPPDEVVDAVPVDDQPPADPGPTADTGGTALALATATATNGSTALIDAPTPKEKIAQARDVADALKDIIVQQGLRTKIGRHKVVQPDGSEKWEDKYHVNVEAWQTLATLLGLAVVEEYTRPVLGDDGRPVTVTYTVEVFQYAKGTTKQQIKNGSAEVARRETYDVAGHSWEAKYHVVKDGVLISSASAMCGREETAWQQRDEFALKSMAQTRAQARAIAAAARWIVTLAGYAGTPAEEMPGNGDAAVGQPVAAGLEVMPDALAGQLSTDLVFLAGGHLATGGKLWDRLLVDGKMPKLVAEAVIVTAKARRAVDERRAQANADASARTPEQAAAEATQDGEPPADRPAAQGSGRSL